MMPVGAKIVLNIAIGIIYICTILMLFSTIKSFITDIKNMLNKETFDDEEE